MAKSKSPQGARKSQLGSLALLIITILSFLPASASERQIKLHGSTITVFFAPGINDMRLSQEELMHWIQNAAEAVAGYYGVFPVGQLQIAVNSSSRSGLHGTAYPGEQPLISLRVSKRADREKLASDWVLVHEMVHLAFPSVHRKHHWLEEGLATYIEPIARVNAGLMPEDDAWRWLLEGIPKGLPETGDNGLDHTPTWGRIYWGGALYCLLADVRIRQLSNNKASIRTALTAIQQAGGTMAQEGLWPIEKALEIGDEATGTQVLSQLYAGHKAEAVDVNLDALWQQLGVSLENDKVIYNEQAPYAKIRKAVMNQAL